MAAAKCRLSRKRQPDMCDLCGNTGKVFAGHAELNGDVVDIYNACDCNPEPTDDDAPHWASDEPRGTAEEDFHPPINDGFMVVVGDSLFFNE
jgi:hypothetical protein